jgi:hypothetical protein
MYLIAQVPYYSVAKPFAGADEKLSRPIAPEILMKVLLIVQEWFDDLGEHHQMFLKSQPGKSIWENH